MKPRPTVRLDFPLASAIAALLAAPIASATQYTWTRNTVATQDWTTAGNWSSVPFVSGTGNELRFFADTTTALANGTNAITTNVPTTLSTNILTLNGLGAAATATAVVNIASSSSTWTLDGTTPTVNLSGLTGTKGLNYTVAANLSLAQATTLFTGSGTAGFNFSGAITGTSAGNGITKAGTSNLTLSGLSATAANNYGGTTEIDAGTLTFSTTNPNLTGGLAFGNSSYTTTTAGNLTLSGGTSATFGGDMTVRTNTSSINTITIGSGTLATNGNVTIGNNVSATGGTKLNVTGASGTWKVVKSGGTFQVGAATGATNIDTVTADLSGLGTFSADLGSTGTFRVGNLSTVSSSTAGNETLTLAATSTIKTGTLSLGENSGQVGANSLLLGTGTQTIQADTINIGLIGSNRSSGTLAYSAGNTTGTLKICGYDGTSAASLKMGVGSFSTSATLTNTFDVTGHTADLLFSTVDLMDTSASNATGIWGSTFSFDKGTLSVTTLKIGTRAVGTGAQTQTATVNIGSAANLTNSATLGAVTIATTNVTGGTIAGNLNIAGTATTVGITSLTVANDTAATGGTATGIVTLNGGATTVTGGVTLAARTSAGTVNGSLILNGGTFTVGGDIVTTGSGGTVTSTITLAGGTLDMGNHAIGGSGQLITNLNWNSGTLKNVTQINNGAGITKSSAGTMILAGTNTYTGTTTLSAGVLQLGNANAVQNSTVSIGVANGLKFSTGIGTFNLGGLSGASNLSLDDGGAGVTLSVGANNANTTYSGTLSDVFGGGALTKVGSGTLTLSSSNSYAGATSITAGTLSLTGSLTGTSGTTISGGTLSLTGSLTAGKPISTSVTGVLNEGPAGVISGAATFTQGSSGTSILSGANTYTGATTISAGSLSINSINNKSGVACAIGQPTTNTTARIIMGSAGANTGTLIYTGAAASTDRNIAIGINSGTSADTGGATIENDGSGSLTFSNAVFNLALTSASANRTLTLQGSNSGTISGVIANNRASALVALTKAGNGTWVLAGTNTYTGATTLSAGTLSVAASANLGGAAANLVFDGGTLQITGTDLADFTTIGHSVSFNANKSVGLDIADATNTFTVDKVLNQGTGGFTKLGNGTAILDQINTYTGATTLSAGILNANSTAALGNSSATNTLILNGGTLQAGADITSAATRGVTLNPTTTSTIDTNANAVSIAGVIGGSGNLNLIGAGSLTLTGSNTYSGSTTISDATTLIANSSAALGNGSATNTLIFKDDGILQAGGTITSISTRGVTLNTTAASTFTIDTNGNDVSIAGIIGGTGSLTKIGDGTLSLSGANTFSPNNTSQISGGMLLATQFASLPLVANSGWFVNVGATLAVRAGGAGEWTTANLDTLLNHGNFDIDSFLGIEVTGSNNFTYANDLAGDQAAKGLTKLGTGTLTLNGANTHSALTTVSAGALNIGSSGSLNDGAALTLSASGNTNFANAGQNLGAVSNSNTSANALNFSATTGTVTLDSLTGAGATRFGSNGIVTNGIAEGTVTSVGNLTADISGGTVTAGGLLTGTISAGTVGAGTLTSSSVTGGTNVVTGSAGITTLNGGSTTVGGVATIGTMTSGIANLNGGTSAIATLNGGTVNLGATTVLTVSGGSTSGSITGSGGRLVKNTGGTLTLSGTNSYTGGTTVSNGKLLINGSLSGAVDVSSIATLGGTGAISGAVNVDGILSPGASIAKLTTGALTLNNNSTFVFEMNHSALPAAAGDLQIVNGNLSLGGTVNLTLTDLGSLTGTFAPNTTLSLIQYAGTWNGGFFTYGGTNVLENNEVFTDISNKHWKITYNSDGGGLNYATSIPGSHFITLSSLTAVPEPGSLLALSCLVGCGAFMRRRVRSGRTASVDPNEPRGGVSLFCQMDTSS